MLLKIEPLTLNKILIDQKGYFGGCNIEAPRVAEIAGYSYQKLSPTELLKQEFPIIGETDHYKTSGVPQHFFILLDPNTIIDPLDLTPSPKKNPYHLISLRIFKPMLTNEEIKAAVFALIGHIMPDDQLPYWQEQGAEKLIRFLIEHEDYLKKKEQYENGKECILNNQAELNKLQAKINGAINLLT